MTQTRGTGGATLKLAGTMSLKTRTISPQSRIKERNGFVTVPRVPLVNDDKKKEAKKKLNKWNKESGQFKPVPNEYSPPKPHQYREVYEVPIGQKDFVLRVK